MADAACCVPALLLLWAQPAIMFAPVPAAMLISLTPSPSLRQPCCLQPMHTKRKLVCTCLPEAMLINSTLRQH